MAHASGRLYVCRVTKRVPSRVGGAGARCESNLILESQRQIPGQKRRMCEF